MSSVLCWAILGIKHKIRLKEAQNILRGLKRPARRVSETPDAVVNLSKSKLSIQKLYVLPTAFTEVIRTDTRTTASISLYSINCLVLMTEEKYVYYAVRTEYLNTIQINISTGKGVTLKLVASLYQYEVTPLPKISFLLLPETNRDGQPPPSPPFTSHYSLIIQPDYTWSELLKATSNKPHTKNKLFRRTVSSLIHNLHNSPLRYESSRVESRRIESDIRRWYTQAMVDLNDTHTHTHRLIYRTHGLHRNVSS